MLNVISVKWLLHQAAFFSALGLGRGITRSIPRVSQSHNGDTEQLSTDITLEGSPSPRGRFSIMESQQGSLAEGGVSVSRLTIKEKLSSSVVLRSCERIFKERSIRKAQSRNAWKRVQMEDLAISVCSAHVRTKQ